ncbi:MAG: oligosaccharide flippase family protein [Phycisphaerae bacterium]
MSVQTLLGRLLGGFSDARSKHFPQGSIRHSMASGAVWSVVGAVLSRGCVLVSSIVIARLLGKLVFGQWGLVTVTVGMFANVAAFGTMMVMTRYVAALRKTDPARASRTMSLALLIGLGSDVVVSSAALALAGTIATDQYGAPELLAPLMVSAAVVLFMVATQILQATLIGFEDFRCTARIEWVQGAAMFVCATGLAWSFGLTGTIVGIALSWALAFGLGLRAVIRACRRHGMHLTTKGIWREGAFLWKSAVPAVLAGGVSGMALTFSQGIVARGAGGIASLGGYNAAIRWRDIIMFLPTAVNRITLPILSRLEGVGDRRRFLKALLANAGLNGATALAGAIPVAFLSKWILGFYGPDFPEDWDMLAILVGMGVVQAISEVVSQVLISKERVWWMLTIVAIWGIMLWGGTWLMAPRLGVRGYVWSLAIAHVFHLLFYALAAVVLIRRSAAAPASPLAAATGATDGR